MYRTMITRRRGISGSALLLVCTGIAYASSFAPSDYVFRTGSVMLGVPEGEGFRAVFVPHVLLYTTFTAAICASMWWFLVKLVRLPPPRFVSDKKLLPWVALGVVGALAITFPIVWAITPAGTIHWIDPVPWSLAGNLFSNFFEEFIYRGFILTALSQVVGFWPAAIASSAMWALQHHQYPVAMQGAVFAVGILWCWVSQRAQTLWAPYLAHVGADFVGDSLIG